MTKQCIVGSKRHLRHNKVQPGAALRGGRRFGRALRLVRRVRRLQQAGPVRDGLADLRLMVPAATGRLHGGQGRRSTASRPVQR